MIQIYALGGYSEVGKNMTLIKYNEESIILDMGIHLENYIKFMGDNEIDDYEKEKKISYHDLKKANALPDDIKIDKKNVLAIIPSHAHLDHIGAIPFMANRYNCPILCSNYTASVIKAIMEDKKEELDNEIITLDVNKSYKLSDNLSVELISITHSIPNATIIVITTPEGKIVYTNDFKFDETPVLGKPINYEILKKIKAKILILDSLYADLDRSTPSEKNAKNMLTELLINLEKKPKKNKNALIITTFSSHIARLKTIIELGEKINRKIVLLGRSLAKYVYAAENIGIINFSNKAKIISYKSQIARYLKKINLEGKEKYLIIATGHQGEPDAVLSQIANDKFKFKLENKDIVIFSCNTIPTELNIENRNILENKLIEKGVVIFKDIHESGHGSRQDHKKIIELLNPDHIIPSHSNKEKYLSLVSLAEQMGYEKGKNIHILEDGETFEIN